MNRRFLLTLIGASGMLVSAAFAQNPMVGGKEMFPEKNIQLPAGTVGSLLKPENTDMLVKVLTYHVVPGKLSSLDLKKQIKMGGGIATLKTVAGRTLWAMTDGNSILLKDEKGSVARIIQANVFQSNGVIHVIDTVVLPD